MVAAAGSAGPRNWRAQLVRNRTEHWARALVDAVRAGRVQPPPTARCASSRATATPTANW
jgi:hypothetical protein